MTEPSEHDMAKLADLKALFEGDLHPELKPYLVTGPFGLMIKHPLVNDIMAIPGMHGHSNRIYEKRKLLLVEFRADRNWPMYVFTHERPWRADALAELIEDGSVALESKADWRLVADVWTDSENVEESDDFWAFVWSHDKSRLAMRAKEAKALAALPDRIEVWHGLERRDHTTLGYSWTTSEQTGRWFATRFATVRARGAYLAHGYVPKDKVHAYLLGRNEFEIIAFPHDVEGVTIRRVKR